MNKREHAIATVEIKRTGTEAYASWDVTLKLESGRIVFVSVMSLSSRRMSPSSVRRMGTRREMPYCSKAREFFGVAAVWAVTNHLGGAS